MKKPNTPFPTSGYYGKAYFCDREAETERLLTNIRSGISTTLIAIRRMGKTGLILHTREQLPPNWSMIYLDILATESRQDLLITLITAVVKAIPEKSSFGKKLWQFIKSLRPVISYDPLTGETQVSVNTQPSHAEKNIQGVLNLLETHSTRVIIAIDEFQQVLHYPEGNTDAWLRSIFQNLKNVVFIYSGSQQHLMQELFGHPSNPFYRSTQFLKLGRINEDDYKLFIKKHFSNHNRKINEDVIYEILSWTRRHTYYVQLLLSRVFTRSEKYITTSSWQDEAYKLLIEQQPVFFGYRDLLTKAQWNLLKAIASEGLAMLISSRSFLEKYRLGTSATILRSMEALLKKELVYYDFDNDGNKYYQVYDLLFERWIQSEIWLAPK